MTSILTPPVPALPEWVKGITLVSGAGEAGTQTCCVMSLARLIQVYELNHAISPETLLSSEREDDFDGVDPLIRSLAIALNDGHWWASNAERTEALVPIASMVIGTANHDQSLSLGVMFADRYFRVLLPIVLRAIGDSALTTCADDLVALPEVVGPETLRAAAAVLDLALARDLARDLALALALDLALARDLALALAIAVGRAAAAVLDLALARDLARDLALALARDLARDLALALALALARDLARLRDESLKLLVDLCNVGRAVTAV